MKHKLKADLIKE